MKNQLMNLVSKLSLLRIMRFGLGVFMGIQAFHGQDILAGILSAVLLWQAYSNAGCAWGACNVRVNNAGGNPEIEAEEVKAKK
ncbi:MAG: hypothetical protein IM638_17285 [Bacteroidetes bacterium]|nr:hypothetical protein [Bacteroidota bacterium]